MSRIEKINEIPVGNIIAAIFLWIFFGWEVGLPALLFASNFYIKF